MHRAEDCLRAQGCHVSYSTPPARPKSQLSSVDTRALLLQLLWFVEAIGGEHHR